MIFKNIDTKVVETGVVDYINATKYIIADEKYINKYKKYPKNDFFLSWKKFVNKSFNYYNNISELLLQEKFLKLEQLL